jgi:transcriptional regulator with PAS, ATPase and Fis domain
MQATGAIDRLGSAEQLHAQAVQSMLGLLETLCQGAIAVDADARVVWINDRYRELLGLAPERSVVGEPVEALIPNSLLRQVIATGRPILLDIMHFDERAFVVTRMPIHDDDGAVIGAVGFVLFDEVNALKPLVGKFAVLQADLARARAELAAGRRSKYTFSQIVGSSAPLLDCKRRARRAAQIDTTVLLHGETGTGKELLAHAIHAASARSAHPFVGINVAAVPETLLEAEFFGVAPGAYTGADRKGRDGKFVLADGGTLFLDEIGDMPLALQAKLLRVLQDQEIEPVGSNRVERVDVRVIAAASHDLRALVEAGRFRADLYYRLNVLPIRLPPLRERLEDLEELCAVLLEQIAAQSGMHQMHLADGALARLRRYRWPGNVRELRNLLEQVAVMSERRTLEEADVAAALPEAASGAAEGTAQPEVRPLAERVAETEREAICAALEVTAGKKRSAARLLGISRAKLYARLEQLAIPAGGRND